MKLGSDMLSKFLLKLPDLKILVVGDLMLDEYLWGGTDRISPEAPVPVVGVADQEMRLGGAGNVALNLAALGCQVAIAGFVGADPDGGTCRELIGQREIDAEALLDSSNRRTTRKTRVIASRQQMLRIDREDRHMISKVEEQQLLAAILPRIAQFDVLLLSDYLKGVMTVPLVQELVAAARKADIPVLIDPKGSDYHKYHGATLLTPNRKEFAEAIGKPVPNLETLVEEADGLCQRLNLTALIVTRSEEGMSLFVQGMPPQHLSTRAREVFDISGAGDTVLALLGAGVAAGMNLTAAAEMANLAAGIVVGKVGTSTVTPQELVAELEHRDLGHLRKLLGRVDIDSALNAARQKGRRIVFTNGCFDLLHVGHVKYLQKARQQGDLLVLGLNSDASIRRIKGPKRPLIKEEERAHILAALDCVDYVVLFDEDTPMDLIREVRPDVLIKGGDYEPAQVVGREFVESYGGRLELIQFVDGKSTTNIINKILESYADEQPL
jgi:D-beta-D-heptose 7-phosphate kinase/D-beta-D-heptose 1-phosphate adenosyltransferase